MTPSEYSGDAAAAALFCIIVPTHNRPLLLKRTLQSLLAQTFKAFSVIVVDDTGDYLPPFEELAALKGRCTYVIRSGARGPAESRNIGLTLATAPYVVFLDDDDSFDADHLQSLADRVGSGSPELLYCNFKARTEDRSQWPARELGVEPVSIAHATTQLTYVCNLIPNSCLAYRRDIIGKLRFDPGMRIYEDWDFLLNCLHSAPGMKLTHLPVHSVAIHKSHGEATENHRRGNSHNELILETTLSLYKKYPAPDMQTRLTRQAYLARADITVGLELC